MDRTQRTAPALGAGAVPAPRLDFASCRRRLASLRGFGRAPAWAQTLCVLFACLLLGACASSGSSEEPDLGGVEERFLPAMAALQEAVAAHDDDTALRILGRIFAMRPQGETLELANSYRRVLEGRVAMADLHARIEARLEGDELLPRVVLENRGERDIEFRPGPAVLRLHRVLVDPTGVERRFVQRGTSPEFGEISLLAGERREVGLQPISQAVPQGVLAVRTTVQLDVRAGSSIHKDERYPAMGLEVEPFEHTRLASFLPQDEVEPEVLVEYLGREVVHAPPMMERAVRIASHRREEALDLCTPMFLAASTSELSRAIPALRWLADTARPGGDPRAWRDWLESRSLSRGEDDSAPRGAGTLILPGRRPDRISVGRDASAPSPGLSLPKRSSETGGAATAENQP